MNPGRLEAFSDGVIAIIITIMVLEMKVPEGSEFKDLLPLLPKFISYVLSFIYVGIYWNNHHHLFKAIQKVNGRILWANLALLFSLSLIPITTAWMGENHFAKNPVALYGLNLLICALTFTIVERIAIKNEGDESKIAQAVGRSLKEYTSAILYVVGIASSFYFPHVSVGFYAIVALIWLVPDRRIEKELS